MDSVKRPRIVAFEDMNIAQWPDFLLNDRVDNTKFSHAPHLTNQRGARTDFFDAIRLANECDGPMFDLRALVKSHEDFTRDLFERSFGG